MRIGSMREVLLTSAKDDFLLNCQLAGFDSITLNAYQDVLDSFIRFTGDMLVRQLRPDHVRTYLHTLDDDPGKSKEYVLRLEINHYVALHTWIRWMQAQKFITEPYSSDTKPLDTRGAHCVMIQHRLENIIGEDGRVAQW